MKKTKSYSNFVYLFGSAIMVAESVFHFSGLRLIDTQSWPIAAQSFTMFFMHLWASASLLIGIILFTLYKNKPLQKYFQLPVGLYLLVHAVLLFWWGSQNTPAIWQGPSLYVWLPFYPLVNKMEAIVCIISSFTLLTESKNAN